MGLVYPLRYAVLMNTNNSAHSGATSQPLISLITYDDLAELDPDDRLLKHALERRGCRVQGLVWDDETIDWSQAGLCVLRSTWNYHRCLEPFFSWLDHRMNHW